MEQNTCPPFKAVTLIKVNFNGRGWIILFSQFFKCKALHCSLKQFILRKHTFFFLGEKESCFFWSIQSRSSNKAAVSLLPKNKPTAECLLKHTCERELLYELCSSKVATPGVMTKVRSQHKESCHGNLYGQKCQILSGHGSISIQLTLWPGLLCNLTLRF